MKCRTCGTMLSIGALLCGECGTSAIAPRPTLGDTAHYDREALRQAIAAERRPTHAVPPARRSHALFSLAFSTGESLRVAGSGLVGRNPVAGAGEHFDYLVQIVDPSRSVSKTHLEFGVDGEVLWVADRGSSNGTRVALDPAASAEPIDLAPGIRLDLRRGARVGIGDQYFDIS